MSSGLWSGKSGLALGSGLSFSAGLSGDIEDVTTQPPVVTDGQNFDVFLPVSAGEEIGLVATSGGAPTSFAILSTVPAGTLTWFAISASGAVTITAAGEANITAASYILNVEALNSGGATNAPVDATVHAAKPVVTPASFEVLPPLSNAQFVGLMSATGNPTSWGLVGTTDFGILPDGTIYVTLAGVDALVPGTEYDFEAEATNASGTGIAPVAVLVLPLPVGDDPTLEFDFTTIQPTDDEFLDNFSFSRPSLGTLFNELGMLTYCPNNLLTYSNTFSNAAWVKAGGTTVTPGQQDPVGGAEAWLLTTPAGTPVLRRTLELTAGVRYTQTMTAKADSVDYIYLQFVLNSVGSKTWFNLADGTIGISQGGVASIVSLGDGWYEVALTYVADSTSGTMDAGAASADGNFNIGGDVYIYDASVSAVTYETSPRPQDQVITTAAAYYGPRFTHDPITLEPLGLLIEMAVTNAVPNSTMQGASVGVLPTGWIVSAGATGADFEVVGTGVARGETYVDIRCYGTVVTDGALDIRYMADDATLLPLNSTTCSSVYLALTDGATPNPTLDKQYLQAFDAGGAVVQTYSSVLNLSSVTDRYNLIIYFSNAAQISVNTHIQIELRLGNVVDFTLRVIAPQLGGTVVSTFIPTTNGPVTRASDLITAKGLLLSVLNSEGVSLLGSTPGKPAATAVLLGYSGANFQFTANGGAASTPAPTLSTGAGNPAYAPTSIIIAWDNLGRSIAASGTAVVSDSVNPYPSGLTSASIGNNYGANSFIQGSLSKLAVWDYRLPDNILPEKVVI